MKPFPLELACCLFALFITPPSFAAGSERPRLVVLTDIGGDPDDQQSLIRLMLYSNEFDIECLIASASGTPGELKQAVTKPELIREIVEAYGKVRVNLVRHAEGFPEATALLERIHSGNPQRGEHAIGDGNDTDGSQALIEIVDRDDSRPVNISIWGGQTELAQALWRVRRDRGQEGLQQFVSKIRVYDIADQDGIAEWIWREFPGLFYVLSKSGPGEDKREAAFRGMYLGGDQALVSREWMEVNIRQDHGPLGALYPPRTWTAPNPHSATKEGDTPSWFYFLPHSLNDPAHPDWGGWGGRFRLADNGIYRDARDAVAGERHARATVWRWRPVFQADFQARLDWCVADDFSKANHAPTAILNGDASRAVVNIEANPGDDIPLTAAGSSDPDQDEVAAHWWIYEEAGSQKKPIKLSNSAGLETYLKAPPEGKTVHVVLELTDSGRPRLTTVRRAVVSAASE